MTPKTVFALGSTLAAALALSACATPQSQVADASAPAKPKPSTLHRYDPFTDPFEALNSPVLSATPNVPRRPGGVAPR